MIILPGALDAETLRQVRAVLDEAEFVDGKATAGVAAREVKHNLQLKRPSREPLAIDQQIVGALAQNEELGSWALPRRFIPPLFSRYEVGMEYGWHVDSAFMGPIGQPLRTDLSVTVALSDASEYEGGELVIRTPAGEEELALHAGDAVVYPSTALHRVKPITRGERLSAVLWIQSYVRDPGMREILHDLDLARRRVHAASPGSEEASLLQRAYANLLRSVAES